MQVYDKVSCSRTSRRTKSISLVVILVLGLSTLLAFQLSPTVAAVGTYTTRAQSVAIDQTLTLRAGYYNYYEADSFSNSTTLAYAVLSSAPISVAVMTSTQLDQFANNLSVPLTNSVALQNGTSIQGNVTITPGKYFLVFYAYYSRAQIQFGYQVSPNTPFSYGAVSSNFASGISTFGVANNSGRASAYEVRTNEIVGVANISSMQINTPNANQYGVSVSGGTLQLNAVLVVNDSSGQKVYWVQNVPDFQTNSSIVSIGDEIWNWTDQNGYLSNQTITSTNLVNGGAVYPGGSQNSGPYVYNYNGPNETYAMPLNVGLLVKETVNPNSGILVQLGSIVTVNGSAISSKVNWFDNVTIVDPSVQSAYFDVSGSATPPVGLYYDAELVFAGEGNLEVAHFTQLNASLGLFYHDSSSPPGVLASFPSYYSFSGDTGESADNLVVNFTNGIASVATGLNPNYVYLGSASRTFSLQTMTSSAYSATAHYNNPAGVESSTGQFAVGQQIQFAVVVPSGSPLPSSIQAFVNGVGQTLNKWPIGTGGTYIYTATASASLVGSTSVYAVVTFPDGSQVITNTATLLVTA
ncbi:MAG: thermopsin family protease [Nitrososphaerota archaeon]|nr:thermopsin family protease [Nitrososphaerota archaeon]